MYVGNYDDNTVSVINTTNNSVVSTINVGNHPTAIAYDPDNKGVYVGTFISDYVGNYLVVINTTSNTINSTNFIGFHILALAYDPDNKNMYATATGDNKSTWGNKYYFQFIRYFYTLRRLFKWSSI